MAGPQIVPDAPTTTLILGGARSGKSRYAEALVTQHPAPWVYVATAEALDDEMRARIAQHQAARKPGWRTIEAPTALADALDQEAARPLLVECLTLWLSNLMLGGHDIGAATAALEAALARRRQPTVLVSNEVGLGIVPETQLGRVFRDEAGRLNQLMAARADHVAFMVAGLPMTLK
ncbi:MAG TPA: bifunctional adenosylcobinamide kinase/adenosylcobinamide-phosphate guanylyltransferase [Rhodopila sp.]